MSDLIQSIMRDFVQKLLGIAFVWTVAHGINLPESDKAAITNWAILGMTALLLLVWTTLVRWLESRKGTSQFDSTARALGRVLMLGIKTTPSYTAPAAPAPPAPPAP